MKVKVLVVDFELPPNAKRWALRLGVTIAILAGASAIAYASVPKTWTAGEVLKAADINGDFSSLDSRVSSLRTHGSGIAI